MHGTMENLSLPLELKALLKDKAFPREIDFQALNHYLTFGYIGGIVASTRGKETSAFIGNDLCPVERGKQNMEILGTFPPFGRVLFTRMTP